MRGFFDLDLVCFISSEAQSVSPELENGGIAKRGSSQRSNWSLREKAQVKQAFGDGALRVDAADRALFAGPKI
jgi:hypothetical protein